MNGQRFVALLVVAALVAVGNFATRLWVSASEPAQAPGISRVITRADDGGTVLLRAGDHFRLQLGEEFNWKVDVSDPSIVRRISDVPVVRGSQGIYAAERVGETDVIATSSLNCAPDQPCPALAALFRVRIVVTALEYRVMLAQLARDATAERDFVVMGTVLAGPTCPVERIPPDPRCADRPVSGARIIFVDNAGDGAGHARSDAIGRFSIVLPAGTYTAIPQPVPGLLGTAPPQAVVVTGPGIEVTVHYDTGIR